jgi:hypothetical protein
LKGETSTGGSEYWDALEGRAEGGTVKVGLVIDKGAFLVLLSMFILLFIKNGQRLSI